MAVSSERIKNHAAAIGFDKVGIVRADVLFAERGRLNQWLERGFHAEMGWMARDPEKRTDPCLIFPEARSVVVTALNYYSPQPHPDDTSRGKISRYAWGDDYHDVMKEKLYELFEQIKIDEPGCAGKVCVDTAPAMDKVWAVKAGIGWMGKHSNVITKDFGSWFFIGEIFLDIELEYDVPELEEHCGTCRACLDACPTKAIVEPYVVDSAKCISYGTIELRAEELPAAIGENLNGWLYGCDICQDVCPWNRFEKPSTEERFEPRAGETSLSLESLLDFTPEQYAERFRRSAIKRAKLPGLKRNALALKRTPKQ
ncbi:MAG: tRNA epoxyqueuosine(34) reductase QueG [Acidobacteriota bacterium]